MKIYGPVSSRRLGKSMGINNIPYKVCGYSCVYCQIGITQTLQTMRQVFFSSDVLVEKAREKFEQLGGKEHYPDYLCIVSDGEPTLDVNLGHLIDKLKTLGVPVAVITNGSMLQFEDVRLDLCNADLVSVKVDTAIAKTWKKINRPSTKLDFHQVKNGILEFSRMYIGKLITETMLIRDLNDSYEELYKASMLVSGLKPDIAYLSVPTRPTAVKGVHRVGDVTLLEAYDIFQHQIKHVRLLNDFEGADFNVTGNLEADLLSITAVHPLREEVVFHNYEDNTLNHQLLDGLVEKDKIKKVFYSGHTYYIRRFEQVIS